MTTYTEDPVVDTVIQSYIDRSAEGMKKYGQSVAADKHRTLVDWLTELQQELMDGTIYLERAKRDAAYETELILLRNVYSDCIRPNLINTSAVGIISYLDTIYDHEVIPCKIS